ncbi:glycosyltransferase [Candidatus Aerophobetes bacterium]|uniref:Glycosyltransferase n=1 Tax=Aerophobetes bacterium TaxID=2030807 RepID=A0A662DAL3_UNCAE|nr:MAG: glycosyltransferase [Candidatus Aerophobetes bacterium]
MKVLFGVCSWGLGHAVRDLPLLKRMRRNGHRITVVGRGRSLEFIKKEMGRECSYYEIPDYSPVYSEKAFSIAKFVGRFPFYLGEVAREHKRIMQLVSYDGYERIISDSRFGVYHPEVPSFFVFHQLRFIAPGRIKIFERCTEGFNYLSGDNFQKILVPDLKEENLSLSGDLSHNLCYFKEGKVEYIGILCDLRIKKVPQDIDYFISISGPEPQRTILEKKILSQLSSLKGKVVVALGKPEEKKDTIYQGARIFSCLNRKGQEEMMNRSRLIITRPGYTTLMELATLGKKALLIPTPGQTEQIYLASYHLKKGNFYSISQEKLNLARDVREAERYPGINLGIRPEEAEEKFMQVVFGKL